MEIGRWFKDNDARGIRYVLQLDKAESKLAYEISTLNNQSRTSFSLESPFDCFELVHISKKDKESVSSFTLASSGLFLPNVFYYGGPLVSPSLNLTFEQINHYSSYLTESKMLPKELINHSKEMLLIFDGNKDAIKNRILDKIKSNDGTSFLFKKGLLEFHVLTK